VRFRNGVTESAARYRPLRFSPVLFRWHSLYPRLYFVVPDGNRRLAGERYCGSVW